MSDSPVIEAPPIPRPGFSIGVTGHTASHASYPADDRVLRDTLDQIFGEIDAAVHGLPAIKGIESYQPCRLHTLLASGVDQLSARQALGRDWQLSIPMAFGRELTTTLATLPASEEDVARMLAGDPPHGETERERYSHFTELARHARLFELADRDDEFATHLRGQSGEVGLSKAMQLEAGMRYAMASRLVVEHAHLIVAVWDGVSTANTGGSGHTVAVALDEGVSVLWIDPAKPSDWTILHTPEALVTRGAGRDPTLPREHELEAIVRDAMLPRVHNEDDGTASVQGLESLDAKHWRHQSSWRSEAYRRLVSSFGRAKGEPRKKLKPLVYERPDAIEQGSGREMIEAAERLPGVDPNLPERMGRHIFRRFAWADGISTHLSDSYRGGMTMNFLLGSLAIIGGTLYLPLVDASLKWIFAGFELLMLLAIIAITINGTRKQLHDRWFQTRRVAEYLRHSPLLLMLGVSRTAGDWPRGTKTSWPEWYVRQTLRDIGLPHARIDRDGLVHYLELMRDHHVTDQRRYHEFKAAQLNRVHHRLEHIGDKLFELAVVTVGGFLVLALLDGTGFVSVPYFEKLAKWFTVAAVALPTLGGAIAGLRFFGDFERFGAISEVTAEKLSAIEERIALLLSHGRERIDYGTVADLAHATDAVVVTEIKNWQSVFSAKRISVPV